MYKVFINQKLVIFLAKDQFDPQLINNKNVLVVKGATFSKKHLKTLMIDNKQGMVIVCNQVKKVWKDFRKNFKVIHAGGGLVLNNKDEMLFIFRKGKWDLPKGKLDKGEKIADCAVREVKEECGIKTLSLNAKVGETYHVYYIKDKAVLKITTWFFMNITKKQKLTPQLEEDITDIRFFSKKNYSASVRKKTYPLIADLISNLPATIY